MQNLINILIIAILVSSEILAMIGSGSYLIPHQSCSLDKEGMPEVEVKILLNGERKSQNNMDFTIQIKNNLNCEIYLYSNRDKQVVRDKRGIRLMDDKEIASGAFLLDVIYQINSLKKPKVFKYKSGLHGFSTFRLNPNEDVYFSIPKKDVLYGRVIALPYITHDMSQSTPLIDESVKKIYVQAPSRFPNQKKR